MGIRIALFVSFICLFVFAGYSQNNRVATNSVSANDVLRHTASLANLSKPASVVTNRAGGPGIAATAPVSATYTVSQSTGGVLSTGGTNILPNAGDQGVFVATPFDLTVYDQTYVTGTNVFIPTKGNMQFTSSTINYSPTCLPTATFTGINLCPYWSDFRTNTGDPTLGVFTSVVGSAPNREWHIRWKVFYWSGTGHAEFEMVLHESLAQFEFIYGDVTGTAGNDVTGATIGIQRTSTCGLQYLCQTTGGMVSGTVLTYTGITTASPSVPVLAASVNPTCSGQPTTLSIQSGQLNDAQNWQWYSGSCGGTPAGTGTSISVSPTITTTYYARGEGGCVPLGSCGTITVTVRPLPTATVSGTTSVCKDASPPNITFTGASGTAPYTFTYKINGGANQTVTTVSGNSVTVAVPTSTPGSYSYSLVSVQDNNTCSRSQSGSATVTVNAYPTATISASGPITFCAGGSVTLTSSAGSTYL